MVFVIVVFIVFFVDKTIDNFYFLIEFWKFSLKFSTNDQNFENLKNLILFINSYIVLRNYVITWYCIKKIDYIIITIKKSKNPRNKIKIIQTVVQDNYFFVVAIWDISTSIWHRKIIN